MMSKGLLGGGVGLHSIHAVCVYPFHISDRMDLHRTEAVIVLVELSPFEDSCRGGGLR